MNKKLSTIDFSLYLIPVILLVVSVALIYSLVMGTNSSGLGVKQGIIGLVGLVLMVGVSFVDYRFFKGAAWVFYVISIILLIFVDMFGKTVNGAMNWINLGFFQLQPSEVAKIFLIITLSSYFCEKIGRITWWHILVSLGIFAVPLALILKEPDLGTGLVVCFIYFFLLLMAKPNKRQLFVLISSVVILASIVAMAYLNIKPFGNIIKEYQRERIAVFIDPGKDPYGRGYNVKQAQITIGSGGLLGKGLGKGSQSQLQFLPEPHTDFIFAGVAESFGYAGAFLLLVVYGYLILRLVDIAILARDNFGLMICFGVMAMLLFQVFINIGMNLGLVPVAGIPLPLLSSGGTSLLITLFSLGLIQSIYIRHRKLSFGV